MGRELNLGDNLDIAHLGVGNQLLDIFLGIVSAQTLGIGTGPGSHLGEAGILLDFEAPTRVVDEVQLQFVELVHGHHVDILLYKFLVVEVAGHVEHHAPPRTVGGIEYRYGRSRPHDIVLATVAVHLGREELQQRLYAVEDTPAVFARHGDALGGHGQAVPFGVAHLARFQFEADGRLAGLGFQRQVPAGRLAEQLLQIFGLLLKRGIVADGRLGGEHEVAFALFDPEWFGYQVEFAGPGRREGTNGYQQSYQSFPSQGDVMFHKHFIFLNVGDS